jgi:cytoskeletal protein CcmA (bactofilin family)
MNIPAHPNTIFAGVEIKGSIKFQTELFIDGMVDGDITSPGSLTLGVNAEIHGEIRAKSVSVQGSVYANIIVEDRCELRKGSLLMGDLKSARLIIEDGATFIGRSEVTPKDEQGVKRPVLPPPIPALAAAEKGR